MATRLKWYEPCKPPISPISLLRFLSLWLASSGGSEAAASDPPWSDLGRPNGVSPREVFFLAQNQDEHEIQRMEMWEAVDLASHQKSGDQF